MNKTLNTSNVAIVHEFLHTMGGAERVLEELHAIYPQAPIFFLTRNKELYKNFKSGDLRCSYLRQLPKYFHKHPNLILPLLPIAAESLNLREYDVVISSSNSFAKGVVTRTQSLHICYCHSPMRYAWDWYHNTLQEHARMKFILAPTLHFLRMWDTEAAKRVDAFIANSKTTQERIAKYYNRESKVVYPPVNINNFAPSKSHDGPYLVVSRLSPYKNIQYIIEAANTLRIPLIIIGSGRYRRHLLRIAGPTVQLVGHVSDAALKDYYEKARALIFAADDDFGISPIEAMASGTPVIALNVGGARETVIHRKTGVLFNDTNAKTIVKAIKQFEQLEVQFNIEEMRKHAEQFSNKAFALSFQRTLNMAYEQKLKQEQLLDNTIKPW